MKEIFILVYLNEINLFSKRKGWCVSTIFEKFPTVEEILDHSCLESDDPNDVVMAKKLVESNGNPHRFIYEGENPSENFFECMIITKRFGEKLSLDELFQTGYADIIPENQILYKNCGKLNC